MVVDELGSCGQDCVLLPVVRVCEESNGMPGLQRHDFRHRDVHDCEHWGDPSQFSDAGVV